ncbi:MAG: HAMP domain-containing histidine kinase [Bdellovibrionaceae bacterium]|nr:HAMP domain-containing histidine kinase [Pseudobdellovibrionaceae bacterium]
MPTKADLFRKISLRRFFVLVICAGVVASSAVYTLMQTWRDFEYEKVSHTNFQEQISEMLANSLREPLIQGGAVETSIRIQSFLKQQSKVICVEIEGRDIPGTGCNGKEIKARYVFSTHNALFYDTDRERSIAKISIFYDNSTLYGSWKRKLRDSLIINIIVSLLIFSFVGMLTARFIKNDLQTVLDECNPESQGKQSSDVIRIKEFSDLFHELKKYIAAARFNAEAHASSEVAKQVAHDIRSPLAAIRMAIESLDTLNEGTRRTIQSAFERINDIANDLMNRWPAFHGQSPSTDDALEQRNVELVNDLVESIVSEKRIQYREVSYVALELKTERKAHALFAHISGHRLKRVLSNLIDNSYEAISQRGKILVSIECEGRNGKISIQDTGKGIPSEILPKLMQKGGTFGKPKGNGLGLYDAKKTIESWGGAISLESKEGTGTKVVITLPLTREPEWFARKITFDATTTVVSIDDDVSVHEIWRARFNSVMDNFDGVRFLSFSSVSEFMMWHASEAGRKCLFLVDYEFLRQKMTGLDLIEKLKIQQNSILVTSRYADTSVSQKAQALSVSVLPKNLAGFIQFEVLA